jgi:hypothetical protein
MKKTSILFVCMIALVAMVTWAPNVNATNGLYDNNCAGCHGTTRTCAGCHAHGVHSDNQKDDIKVIAMTDFLTYAPGETVTVSISGGYRPGWVRTILYDENGAEVNRSEGPTGFGGGLPFPGPIELTAPAPTTPGTYTWTASWYGNEFDSGGAAFGDFVPDPLNSGHGEERVNTNSFEVVAANQPPVADPNGPYTGVVDVAVMFDGTGSSDPDGTIASYDWDFGDGTTGTGPQPQHAYAAADVYEVTLTVTDDAGDTSDPAMTTATVELPACESDINGDGFVNYADLAELKANFFTDCSTLPPGTDCVGDINNDGFVNFGDLALMKQEFFRDDCPVP